MMIAYKILLFLIVSLFGMLAIGAEDERLKDRAGKLTGLALVSLLITFWIT